MRASVSLKPVAAANKASTSKNGSSSTAKRKIEDDDDGDSDDGPVKPAKKRLSTGGDALAPRKKLTKIESESDYQDDDDDVKPRPSNGKQNGKGPKDESDEEDEPVKNVTKAPVKKPTPKKPTASSSSRASTTKAAKAEDEDGEEPKPKAKWTYKPREGPANPGRLQYVASIGSGTECHPPLRRFERDTRGCSERSWRIDHCFHGRAGVAESRRSTGFGKTVWWQACRRGFEQDLVCGARCHRVGPKEAGNDQEEQNSHFRRGWVPQFDRHTVCPYTIVSSEASMTPIACRGAKDLDKKYVDKQKEDAEKIKKAAKALAVDPQYASPLRVIYFAVTEYHSLYRLSKHALWTVKYAPTSVKELCGNPGVAEKLQKWLDAWCVDPLAASKSVCSTAEY